MLSWGVTPMARWKRGLIGAGAGALPGVVLAGIVTVLELIWGPQEIALTLGVLGVMLAIVGLIVGAYLGATGPRRKRTLP